jgi:cytochrome c oxidase assembly protein subunit 15
MTGMTSSEQDVGASTPTASPTLSELLEERRPRTAAVLAIGFGATVAMWTVGYLGRLPIVMAPSWLVGVGILAALVGAGVVAGRDRALNLRGVALAGGVCATLNLLVLGSLLAESEKAMHEAVLWLPIFYLGCMALLGVGVLAGRLLPKRARLEPINWTARFAWTAVVATGLLIAAGGLVTGADAGLSVPDWPGTFGENLFFYPLSRMTGAIYFEHAHRLYGALVGVTTIALAVHLWLSDRRIWLKWLALVAIIAVIGQGVMGGVRVTAAETGEAGVAVSGPEHETSLSVFLRIAHGVFGQVFFALMTFIAIAVSRAWRRITEPYPHASAATERQLSALFVAAIIAQLILGTIARHTGNWVLLHVTFAAVVGCLAYAAAIRAWMLYDTRFPVLRSLGVALMLLVSLQLLLGLAAYVAVGLVEVAEMPTIWNITITTAHQVGGALLFATATALAALTHRQLTPKPQTQQQAAEVGLA